MSDKIHPIKEANAVFQDKCPKCGGELDTGWECNTRGCDYDGIKVAKGIYKIEDHT